MCTGGIDFLFDGMKLDMRFLYTTHFEKQCNSGTDSERSHPDQPTT